MQPVLDVKRNIVPPPTNQSEQENTWCGRVWRVISSPFVWLIEKIAAFVNYLFFNENSNGKNSPTIHKLLPSLVPPKDTAPIKEEIQNNLIHDLRGEVFFLTESICTSE